MILIQAVINVAGLVVGTHHYWSRKLCYGIFHEYFSWNIFIHILAEVLPEQINEMNKKKAIAMVIANLFLTVLILFEKIQ